MRRNAAVALAAAAGAAVGALIARRRRPLARPGQTGDGRADDLRRKLAEAKEAGGNEDDFEAAGMGAETVAPDPTAVAPASPPPATAPAEEGAKEPPPADEFEAMRRRVHEEARAAAEEMRRTGDPPSE